MTVNNNFILSGKYQILRSLGQGQTSTVYLARHLTLEAERAIKMIPKSSNDSILVLSEAQLLKSLSHPGIPIIYDIEEDDNYYYLIEEYVIGESLEEFLLHQKFISLELFLSFCKQLCEIYRYLHSIHPVPILYQDVKPEHIIVCGMQLKLIDFGTVWNDNNSGNNSHRFGNIAFSAPESLNGTEISVQSDIYSLGKIFEFLTQYLSEPVPQNIQHIIQKAISVEPEQRYETVELLDSAIQNSIQKERHTHLSKTIAIVGSNKGCGCTHLGISIVSICNQLGISSFYHEKNNTNSLRKMIDFQPNMKETDGYYIYKGFRGYPFYGPGISVSRTEEALHIMDYGSNFTQSDLQNADLILFICAGSTWNLADAIEKEEILHSYRDHTKFICNPGNRQIARFYARQFSSVVYSYFYDENPFSVSKQKNAFVLQLLSEKGRAHPFLNLHTRIQNIFQK